MWNDWQQLAHVLAPVCGQVAQRVHGVAVRLRNSGAGSVARHHRVSVWCVSIWLSNSLSVLLDLSRTNTHIHTGKLAVFFLKSVTELNLWGLPLSLSHFRSLSLSRSDALISAFVHSLQFLHLRRFKPSLLGRKVTILCCLSDPVQSRWLLFQSCSLHQQAVA